MKSLAPFALVVLLLPASVSAAQLFPADFEDTLRFEVTANTWITEDFGAGTVSPAFQQSFSLVFEMTASFRVRPEPVIGAVDYFVDTIGTVRNVSSSYGPGPITDLDLSTPGLEFQTLQNNGAPGEGVFQASEEIDNLSGAATFSNLGLGGLRVAEGNPFILENRLREFGFFEVIGNATTPPLFESLIMGELVVPITQPENAFIFVYDQVDVRNSVEHRSSDMIVTITRPSVLTPVPLPATAWMALVGIGGLFGLRRFRTA